MGKMKPLSARAVSTTILLVVGAAIGTSQERVAQDASQLVPEYGYEVVRAFPHDRDAFTQGLQFINGFLYESTGLHGRSSIRRVALETGEVLQRRNLPAQYFGEGLVLVGQQLFQLTWRENTALVYDATTFNLTKSFTYRGEGWGLTYDGASLVMSDGTEQLRFLDPATFAERRRIRVTWPDGTLQRALNELEMVDGEVWANVFETDRVVRIDPQTGRILGVIDLTGLLPIADRIGANVLNGIAYDARGNRLFVTGKLWPRVFEVGIIKR